MRRGALLTAWLIVSAAAVAGCFDTEGETGSLSAYLATTNDENATGLHLIISAVAFRVDPTENGTASESDVDAPIGDPQPPLERDAGWRPLVTYDEGLDVDVGNLSGERAIFLGERLATAGRYGEVTLIIDGAYLDNGTGEPQIIPLRSRVAHLDEEFHLPENEEVRLTLVFNVTSALIPVDGTGLDPRLANVTVEAAPDELSGEEVHDIGEVVALPFSNGEVMDNTSTNEAATRD